MATKFNELIAEINAELSAFSTQVGIDIVSTNVTGVTDFTNAQGAYVDSPLNPWTASTIPLQLGSAVKGGISAIWYKGSVLTKASFTGGTVTMFSGVNVANELCRVFVDYDEGSGAFSVNIQTGFTGDLPEGPIEDTTPPATMSITSVVTTSDTTAPATMEITSIT